MCEIGYTIALFTSCAEQSKIVGLLYMNRSPIHVIGKKKYGMACTSPRFLELNDDVEKAKEVVFIKALKV
jgi:hypothetical protein